MSLVRCATCGEVVDVARVQICPGCGNTHAALPVEAPPVRTLTPPAIQLSQREAKRDSTASAVILVLLGLFLLVPFILGTVGAAGLPISVGLLLSAIAVTGTVVFAVNLARSPAVEYHGDSSQAGGAPYEASGHRASAAGQFLRAFLIVVGVIFGLIGVAVVGFAVFLFIACGPLF